MRCISEADVGQSWSYEDDISGSEVSFKSISYNFGASGHRVSSLSGIGHKADRMFGYCAVHIFFYLRMF